MPASLAHARRYQIGFAVLLVVCVAQVGWWLLDQWMFSAEVEEAFVAMHQRNLAAARLMLDGGAAVDQIIDLFPDVVAAEDGRDVRIDPAALDALRNERGRRLNRYAWEGGFFLIVLLAAIGVLWQAVRTEQRLRRRQHNFVTAVTHELKSPLASMRLSAETLELRDGDTATRRRLLARLLSSLRRMEETVSNVLETARIDDGKLQLRPQPVDLAAVVREAVDGLAETAASGGVAVRHNVDARVDVESDREAVAVVLRNLLSNAISAAAGSAGAEVTIRAARSDGNVVVEVRDNGRGFPPGDADKLFDKFYRPGDELRREGRGTGLGLFIARYLVEESGGSLTGHSRGPGRGATFRAAWPPAPGTAPGTAPDPGFDD